MVTARIYRTCTRRSVLILISVRPEQSKFVGMFTEVRYVSDSVLLDDDFVRARVTLAAAWTRLRHAKGSDAAVPGFSVDIRLPEPGIADAVVVESLVGEFELEDPLARVSTDKSGRHDSMNPAVEAHAG